MSHCQRHRQAARRGFTIAEATLALAILSVAFVMLAQFLAVAAHQRRTSEQRRLALQEAVNVLERISALAPSELNAERLKSWQASDELLRAVPLAKLRVLKEPTAGPPMGERVRVEIAWPSGASGELGEPIGLTAYLYPREPMP